MVFYLDLILLLNLVIDYLILILTAYYLKLSYRKWRIFFAAVIGALYTLVFFLPDVSFVHLFLTKVLLSFVIVFISFGFGHLYKFLQTIATFYFVSFLTGGGVFALQYMLNIKHDVINGIYISRTSSPNMSLALIFIGFIGIWGFSKRTYRSFKMKANITSKIVDGKIFINNNNYPFKGLIDTGNQLYDPITRKPVIIIEANKLPFLPEILKQAYRNEQFNLDLFNKISDDINPDWLAKIQLVPFKSISKGMQFILTLRPDKVVITTEEGEEITKTRVLVGLDYGRLSNDQSYEAIIHPELLAG